MAENSIILKIGELDLTGYTLQGAVQIQEQAVYAPQSFMNVKGKTIKTYLGTRISLSVDFEQLTTGEAAAIQTACSAAEVKITFLNPNETTAIFERPSVNAQIDWEDDDQNQYWSLSIQAECPLLGDGL